MSKKPLTIKEKAEIESDLDDYRQFRKRRQERNLKVNFKTGSFKLLPKQETVKPQRIQLKRTKGFNLQKVSQELNGLDAVKVARPTIYGNPYKVGEFVNINTPDGSHVHRQMNLETALEYFEGYLKQKIRFNEIDLSPLKGKNLGCFCPLDKKCHADILLEYAN
jgi:hypothetical protein